jgi:hypothetical protein
MSWTPRAFFYIVALSIATANSRGWLMNLFSLIVTGLFGLLMAAFAGLLFAAIVFNLNVGKKYRQALARDIDKLRLSRMLGALGIDVTSYLHSERIVDIQQQMSRCSDCGRTAECDDRLAAGKVDAAEIGFCNNEQSLQQILEREKSPAHTEQ